MNRLPVRLRAGANQDFKNIYGWISEFGYPQIAERLIERIFERCESLGEFPI